MVMAPVLQREPRSLPMLFSAPMVRAILAGQKTVTRRIVKEPKVAKLHGRHSLPDRHFFDRGFGDGVYLHWFYGGGDVGDDAQATRVFAPWQKGDRLWVRETWKTVSFGRHYPTRATQIFVEYREQYSSRGAERGNQHKTHWECSDEENEELCRKAYGSARAHAWRPAIHMPRWASRLTLEVTNVRAERLRDMPESDVAREGVAISAPAFPRQDFAELWDSINGERPGCLWMDSPWVWRVEFRRVKP